MPIGLERTEMSNWKQFGLFPCTDRSCQRPAVTSAAGPTITSLRGTHGPLVGALITHHGTWRRGSRYSQPQTSAAGANDYAATRLRVLPNGDAGAGPLAAT